MHRIPNNLKLFFRKPAVGPKTCRHPIDVDDPLPVEDSKNCLECAVRVKLLVLGRSGFVLFCWLGGFADNMSHLTCELTYQAAAKGCACALDLSRHCLWQIGAHKHGRKTRRKSRRSWGDGRRLVKSSRRWSRNLGRWC